MKNRDVIMMLVALVVLLRRKVEWGSGWVWPVPSVSVDKRTYRAVISQESHDGHNGVDIMYRRLSPTDLVNVYRPGTADGNRRDPSRPGSGMNFAPPHTPIVAAKSGTVWQVTKSPRGWEVVISHGKPFATYYQHLESVALEPHAHGVNTRTGKPTNVVAGQPIGYMGGDPTESTHLRHLHFEVWNGGDASHAVSPDDEMQSWPRVPWLYTP